MSGGPPHHPHGRQAPPNNSAWNHLQVPNYFPTRQPQHAHMSNEHPMLPTPTWHTPTTEPMKTIPSHPHMFNLEQMLSERTFPRHSPGVDLTLTRNGSQNGDLPTAAISLSVRDTNKINSLPPGALNIQAVELTKSTSPCLKSISPGIKTASPGVKPMSPGISTSPIERQSSPKNTKKPKRVESILERLNPVMEKTEQNEKPSPTIFPEQTPDKTEKAPPEKLPPQSVIVQPAHSIHDDNSNSSSILNVPTPSNIREDDVVSPYSNEDSLDSNKSRRKRKPSKTVRVTKDTEKIPEEDPLKLEPNLKENISTNTPEKSKETPVSTEVEKLEKNQENNVNDSKLSKNQSKETSPVPRKTRRKTSSESETIAKIAAMVNESLQKQTETQDKESQQKIEDTSSSKAVSVSVITTNEKLPETIAEKEKNNQETTNCQPPPLSTIHSTTTIQTPAQRKATNFVEVENKLEEMFAGIEEASGTSKIDPLEIDSDVKIDDLISDTKDESVKFDTPSTSQNQDVTSTSNDLMGESNTTQKRVRPPRRKSCKSFLETTPKKKKLKKVKHSPSKLNKISNKKGKKSVNGKQINMKVEAIKDIYAYDSGSNTSSVRSKGPFIQIRGPRDSPISVSIVNTAVEDDCEKKPSKSSKKFHDDSEYRHKVRSKGLHCSTLSNKYDAQTRDISWICAFCKRGPHSTDPNIMGPTFNTIYPPGDLFGPYVITSNSPVYERRLDDPYDTQFKSKKIARVIEAAGGGTTNVKVTGKKSKRKHSESDRSLLDADDVNLGITGTGDKTFEIWVHEDCVVWSPGVYLIGPKIIGLEEAVWTSCNISCRKCNYKGANVCCLKRGCTKVMHFGCAVISKWQLDEENYKALCFEHQTV